MIENSNEGEILKNLLFADCPTETDELLKFLSNKPIESPNQLKKWLFALDGAEFRGKIFPSKRFEYPKKQSFDIKIRKYLRNIVEIIILIILMVILIKYLIKQVFT